MLIKIQAINHEKKLKPRARHKDSRKTGGSVGLPRTTAHSVHKPTSREHRRGPRSPCAEIARHTFTSPSLTEVEETS